MTPESKNQLAMIQAERNFKMWDFERLAECAARSARYDAIDVSDARWAGEPDKVQWVDSATDYDCLILRNHLGSLCGYVGLPPGHPFYADDYSKVPVDVHGGLTFGNYCSPSESPDSICHIPLDGRPDRVYWLGFDCNHGCDLSPALGLTTHASYKTLAYVIVETKTLALQLKGLET